MRVASASHCEVNRGWESKRPRGCRGGCLPYLRPRSRLRARVVEVWKLGRWVMMTGMVQVLMPVVIMMMMMEMMVMMVMMVMMMMMVVMRVPHRAAAD